LLGVIENYWALQGISGMNQWHGINVQNFTQQFTL